MAGNYFAQKHVSAMDLSECTPWHNSMVFLTAHAAFNLEYEQALQSVSPSVALPYWEYSIDSGKYFGKINGFIWVWFVLVGC